MEPKNQSNEQQNDKADCYSEGERKAMVWYQELRERWLGPLLRVMAAIGIKPDHLTLLSLIFGLQFAWLIYYEPWVAFLCLFLHAAIDGLDGPLARHLRTDSKAGSFTDTMCDQIVLVVATVSLMCHSQQFIGVLPGTIYIFLYTIVVVFAMVRNAMGIPYSWVVRPRFVVYIWAAFELFVFDGSTMAGSINYLIWVFNGLFAMRMATGFLKIRAEL